MWCTEGNFRREKHSSSHSACASLVFVDKVVRFLIPQEKTKERTIIGISNRTRDGGVIECTFSLPHNFHNQHSRIDWEVSSTPMKLHSWILTLWTILLPALLYLQAISFDISILHGESTATFFLTQFTDQFAAENKDLQQLSLWEAWLDRADPRNQNIRPMATPISPTSASTLQLYKLGQSTTLLLQIHSPALVLILFLHQTLHLI